MDVPRLKPKGDLNVQPASHEDELSDAKQRLESLLENSPLAVIEWSSADYRIVRWSDEATRVFGWTAEETVGKRIDELNCIYAEDLPLVEQVMADMLSGKRPCNVNKNRNIRKDGSVIHCEWYNSTVRDVSGKFSVLSLVLDVTERKRAEAALRESERLLADVLDGSPMPVFLKDLNGRFLTVNKRLEELLGLTREQLKGKTDDEIFSRDNASTYREHDRRVIESKRPITVEETAEFVDGRHVYLNSKFPLVDPAGRVYGVGAISHDITDRKRAEAALYESEEKYRLLIEHAVSAVAVHEIVLDAAGRPVDYIFRIANPAFEIHTGLRLADILGRRVTEVLPGIEETPLIAIYGKVALTGEPVSFEQYFKPLNRHYLISAYRVGEGRFATAFTDITERKQAEIELRDQTTALQVARQLSESDKRRLEAALESRAKIVRLYGMLSRVNEAIVRCREEQDLHERVCSILVEVGGYPLAWIGQVQGERVVPTAASGPDAQYVDEITVTVDGEYGKGPTGTSIREGRAVVNHDFRAEALMGPWRERAIRHGFRSSAAFPLRRGDAVVASLTLYAREPAAFDAEHTRLLEALAADLSFAHDAIEDEHHRALAEESLARSEAKLREADERKSQFLAVLSHELRNPLAPIKNSLHILHRVAPGGDQAIRAQAVIERQVDQLTRLVDDLLDVTRLTRGKLRLERARLDLVEAIRRTTEDHRPLFDSAGIDFDVMLVARPLWMLGDVARLAQVVGNLLTNAAKFTPKGGKVVLRIDEDSPGTATIRVQDTGVGIPKELLRYLFDPFMQVESTIDRSRGGLGLGLALVKGVVEMHSGSVEPHSEGLGCGAEFIVKLPVEAAPSPSVREAKVASAPLPPRRVLVVEDNVDAALSLRDVLILCGHEVEVAYNGCDGLEKARAFNPDVVICDIGLPGMDGYAVAKALRADEKLCSARLIALSGYAQPEDLRRSAAAGFDTHISKPASIQAIEEALS